MFTLVAIIAVIVGSFVLATLALPLLLQVALNRFVSHEAPPMEFIVRGTHREMQRTTLERRSRAFAG